MARWDLERGIYALATAVFRFNYVPFVGIALAQSALQSLPVVMGDPADAVVFTSFGGIAASLLQVLLLYIALFTLMTGGRAVEHPFPWPRFWGFFGRLLLLGLAPALVMMAGLVTGGTAAFGLMSLAVSLAVLGLFGTVVPDVVAGGAGRPGDALERGRRTFARFLGWILAGPVLASLAIGLGLGLLSGLLVATGVGVSGAGVLVQPSPWLVGLLTLLGNLGGAYVAALTAAVLGKTWAAGGGTITPAREAR